MPQCPFFVAGAAQGDPEALRRAFAIPYAPEVAPPGIARKAQSVELAPLTMQLHLDAPLDTDDVTDT